MDAPQQLVTQAEYARHRDVSRQAVGKLVAAGKIPVHGDDKLIDPAEADIALGENRARLDEPREREPSPESAGLTRARTATEVYKARRAQLLYEQDLGKALPLDGVVDAAAQCGESVVRIVRSLSSSRAEELAVAAGQGGIAAVRAALKTIEREMLSRISTAFTDMAAQATAARAAQAASDVGDAE